MSTLKWKTSSERGYPMITAYSEIHDSAFRIQPVGEEPVRPGYGYELVFIPTNWVGEQTVPVATALKVKELKALAEKYNVLWPAIKNVFPQPHIERKFRTFLWGKPAVTFAQADVDHAIQCFPWLVDQFMRENPNLDLVEHSRWYFLKPEERT